MNNLIEYKENLDPPLYRPSHLESLKQKHDYFEVPDLETKTRHSDITVLTIGYNKTYYKSNTSIQILPEHRSQ